MVERLQQPLTVSDLCLVEVVAALWRKQRNGELDIATARTLSDEFKADLYSGEGPGRWFVVVATTWQILERAADLVAAHSLRAYDSVQLAAAIAARAAGYECDTFACFDKALRDAAATERFRLIPQ